MESNLTRRQKALSSQKEVLSKTRSGNTTNTEKEIKSPEITLKATRSSSRHTPSSQTILTPAVNITPTSPDQISKNTHDDNVISPSIITSDSTSLVASTVVEVQDNIKPNESNTVSGNVSILEPIISSDPNHIMSTLTPMNEVSTSNIEKNATISIQQEQQQQSNNNNNNGNNGNTTGGTTVTSMPIVSHPPHTTLNDSNQQLLTQNSKNNTAESSSCSNISTSITNTVVGDTISPGMKDSSTVTQTSLPQPIVINQSIPSLPMQQQQPMVTSTTTPTLSMSGASSYIPTSSVYPSSVDMLAQTQSSVTGLPTSMSIPITSVASGSNTTTSNTSSGSMNMVNRMHSYLPSTAPSSSTTTAAVAATSALSSSSSSSSASLLMNSQIVTLPSSISPYTTSADTSIPTSTTTSTGMPTPITSMLGENALKTLSVPSSSSTPSKGTKSRARSSGSTSSRVTLPPPQSTQSSLLSSSSHVLSISPADMNSYVNASLMNNSLSLNINDSSLLMSSSNATTAIGTMSHSGDTATSSSSSKLNNTISGQTNMMYNMPMTSSYLNYSTQNLSSMYPPINFSINSNVSGNMMPTSNVTGTNTMNVPNMTSNIMNLNSGSTDSIHLPSNSMDDKHNMLDTVVDAPKPKKRYPRKSTVSTVSINGGLSASASGDGSENKIAMDMNTINYTAGVHTVDGTCTSMMTHSSSMMMMNDNSVNNMMSSSMTLMNDKMDTNTTMESSVTTNCVDNHTLESTAAPTKSKSKKSTSNAGTLGSVSGDGDKPVKGGARKTAKAKTPQIPLVSIASHSDDMSHLLDTNTMLMNTSSGTGGMMNTSAPVNLQIPNVSHNSSTANLSYSNHMSSSSGIHHTNSNTNPSSSGMPTSVPTGKKSDKNRSKVTYNSSDGLIDTTSGHDKTAAKSNSSDGHTGGNTSNTMNATSSSSSANTHIKYHLTENGWKYGYMPSLPLPKRQKTHWDYVLDEVSWMALDYRQELRSKLTQQKLLAEACSRHVHHTIRLKYQQSQKQQSQVRASHMSSLSAEEREVQYTQLKSIASKLASRVKALWISYIDEDHLYRKLYVYHNRPKDHLSLVPSVTDTSSNNSNQNDMSEFQYTVYPTMSTYVDNVMGKNDSTMVTDQIPNLLTSSSNSGKDIADIQSMISDTEIEAICNIASKLPQLQHTKDIGGIIQGKTITWNEALTLGHLFNMLLYQQIISTELPILIFCTRKNIVKWIDILDNICHLSVQILDGTQLYTSTYASSPSSTSTSSFSYFHASVILSPIEEIDHFFPNLRHSFVTFHERRQRQQQLVTLNSEDRMLTDLSIVPTKLSFYAVLMDYRDLSGSLNKLCTEAYSTRDVLKTCAQAIYERNKQSFVLKHITYDIQYRLCLLPPLTEIDDRVMIDDYLASILSLLSPQFTPADWSEWIAVTKTSSTVQSYALTDILPQLTIASIHEDRDVIKNELGSSINLLSSPQCHIVEMSLSHRIKYCHLYHQFMSQDWDVIRDKKYVAFYLMILFRLSTHEDLLHLVYVPNTSTTCSSNGATTAVAVTTSGVTNRDKNTAEKSVSALSDSIMNVVDSEVHSVNSLISQQDGIIESKDIQSSSPRDIKIEDIGVPSNNVLVSNNKSPELLSKVIRFGHKKLSLLSCEPDFPLLASLLTMLQSTAHRTVILVESNYEYFFLQKYLHQHQILFYAVDSSIHDEHLQFLGSQQCIQAFNRSHSVHESLRREKSVNGSTSTGSQLLVLRRKYIHDVHQLSIRDIDHIILYGDNINFHYLHTLHELQANARMEIHDKCQITRFLNHDSIVCKLLDLSVTSDAHVTKCREAFDMSHHAVLLTEIEKLDIHFASLDMQTIRCPAMVTPPPPTPVPLVTAEATDTTVGVGSSASNDMMAIADSSSAVGASVNSSTATASGTTTALSSKHHEDIAVASNIVCDIFGSFSTSALQELNDMAIVPIQDAMKVDESKSTSVDVNSGVSVTSVLPPNTDANNTVDSELIPSHPAHDVTLSSDVISLSAATVTSTTAAAASVTPSTNLSVSKSKVDPSHSKASKSNTSTSKVSTTHHKHVDKVAPDDFTTLSKYQHKEYIDPSLISRLQSQIINIYNSMSNKCTSLRIRMVLSVAKAETLQNIVHDSNVNSSTVHSTTFSSSSPTPASLINPSSITLDYDTLCQKYHKYDVFDLKRLGYGYDESYLELSSLLCPEYVEGVLAPSIDFNCSTTGVLYYYQKQANLLGYDFDTYLYTHPLQSISQQELVPIHTWQRTEYHASIPISNSTKDDTDLHHSSILLHYGVTLNGQRVHKHMNTKVTARVDTARKRLPDTTTNSIHDFKKVKLSWNHTASSKSSIALKKKTISDYPFHCYIVVSKHISRNPKEPESSIQNWSVIEDQLLIYIQKHFQDSTFTFMEFFMNCKLTTGVVNCFEMKPSPGSRSARQAKDRYQYLHSANIVSTHNDMLVQQSSSILTNMNHLIKSLTALTVNEVSTLLAPEVPKSESMNTDLATSIPNQSPRVKTESMPISTSPRSNTISPRFDGLSPDLIPGVSEMSPDFNLSLDIVEDEDMMDVTAALLMNDSNPNTPHGGDVTSPFSNAIAVSAFDSPTNPTLQNTENNASKKEASSERTVSVTQPNKHKLDELQALKKVGSGILHSMSKRTVITKQNVMHTWTGTTEPCAVHTSHIQLIQNNTNIGCNDPLKLLASSTANTVNYNQSSTNNMYMNGAQSMSNYTKSNTTAMMTSSTYTDPLTAAAAMNAQNYMKSQSAYNDNMAYMTANSNMNTNTQTTLSNRNANDTNMNYNMNAALLSQQVQQSQSYVNTLSSSQVNSGVGLSVNRLSSSALQSLQQQMSPNMMSQQNSATTNMSSGQVLQQQQQQQQFQSGGQFNMTSSQHNNMNYSTAGYTINNNTSNPNVTTNNKLINSSGSGGGGMSSTGSSPPNNTQTMSYMTSGNTYNSSVGNLQTHMINTLPPAMSMNSNITSNTQMGTMNNLGTTLPMNTLQNTQNMMMQQGQQTMQSSTSMTNNSNNSTTSNGNNVNWNVNTPSQQLQQQQQPSTTMRRSSPNVKSMPVANTSNTNIMSSQNNTAMTSQQQQYMLQQQQQQQQQQHINARSHLNAQNQSQSGSNTTNRSAAIPSSSVQSMIHTAATTIDSRNTPYGNLPLNSGLYSQQQITAGISMNPTSDGVNAAMGNMTSYTTSSTGYPLSTSTTQSTATPSMMTNSTTSMYNTNATSTMNTPGNGTTGLPSGSGSHSSTGVYSGTANPMVSSNNNMTHGTTPTTSTSGANNMINRSQNRTIEEIQRLLAQRPDLHSSVRQILDSNEMTQVEKRTAMRTLMQKLKDETTGTIPRSNTTATASTTTTSATTNMMNSNAISPNMDLSSNNNVNTNSAITGISVSAPMGNTAATSQTNIHQAVSTTDIKANDTNTTNNTTTHPSK